MAVPHSKPIGELRSTSVVGMGVACTIWFLVFGAAVLVPLIVAPILLVTFAVYQLHTKNGAPRSARSRAVSLGWSALWLLTFAFVLVMPCAGVPILLMIMQVHGIHPHIATRISTHSQSADFAGARGIDRSAAGQASGKPRWIGHDCSAGTETGNRANSRTRRPRRRYSSRRSGDQNDQRDHTDIDRSNASVSPPRG